MMQVIEGDIVLSGYRYCCTTGSAYAPLYGVQSVGTICDMGHSDIFATGHEIGCATTYQGTIRYLKRLCLLGSIWYFLQSVDIHRIIADTYAVTKLASSCLRIFARYDFLLL